MKARILKVLGALGAVFVLTRIVARLAKLLGRPFRRGASES